MCGIAEIINRKNIPVKDYKQIDRMFNRIKHRGPGDTGVCGITLDKHFM